MVIDPNVRISNVNIDKDEQIISFNLTGIGVGSSYVNVYVFNNGTSATQIFTVEVKEQTITGLCLLYTSPSPRDLSTSRMPSSA